MKKFIIATMLIGTAFTASACSTNSGIGYVDQAPYADERTASSDYEPVIEPVKSKAPSAEKIFVKKQAK